MFIHDYFSSAPCEGKLPEIARPYGQACVPDLPIYIPLQ